MNKLTKEEINQQADTIINNDIGTCQTHLVEECLKKEIFTCDDIENIYQKWEEYYEANSDKECKDCESDYEPLNAEEVCEDCFDPEPQDIYEWWPVSQWLCGGLRDIGQPVIDNDYGYWWGRTCSGQQISCDNTIQELVKNMNK